MDTSKIGAVASILLGIAAIAAPYLFGTFAMMVLGGVILASGIVALLYVNAARREGFPLGVYLPWLQIAVGLVIFVWPGLALWIIAVALGGGLILSGVIGLAELRELAIVNPPRSRRLEQWVRIALGALLILSGAAGSAILLGLVLGIALIGHGVQQWRYFS